MKNTPVKKRTKSEEHELIYNAFSLMLKSGRKLSVAESFTGGLIAYEIVSLPGASKFFHEGVVAYSNLAKSVRLRVSPETIKKHSEVSVEAVYEMALGLFSDPEADIVIATTGYAGPSAPSDEKVGQCCIAVGDRKKIHIYKYKFGGGRENIMRNGMLEAFTRLVDYLNSQPVKIIE